jgi:hypothetical protein
MSKAKAPESVTRRAQREGRLVDLSGITADEAQARYAARGRKPPTSRKARKAAPAPLVATTTPSRPAVLDLLDAAGWMAGDTWHAWRCLTRATFGDALAPADIATTETFTRFTGRPWPTERMREVYVASGRGSGKSLWAARVGVALAVTFDRAAYPNLAPGERPIVLLLASDRAQSEVLFAYALGALQSDPALAALIEGDPTLDRIDLRNGVSIMIGTSSYRWARGRLYLAVLADEAAFWDRQERANSPEEIFRALKPGLRLDCSVLIVISTVYRRRGPLYAADQAHYGRAGRVLVWKSSTSDMNPSYDVSMIAAALAADPQAARAEYLSEYRSDLESYLSAEVIEACVDRGVATRGLLAGPLYVAFADPSGAGTERADSMVLAIAHPEVEADGTVVSVLDLIDEVRPPFSPDAVVARFAETCRAYGIDYIRGDRYGGSWPASRFAAYGLHYDPSAKPKSDLYVEAVGALFSPQRARLLDHPVLLRQLSTLERRTGRGGRDAVDHPPGARDDVANAVVGALLLCQEVAEAAVATARADISPTEAAQLADFSRTFGMPVPPGGFDNLALDDDGEPIDRRYRDGGFFMPGFEPGS